MQGGAALPVGWLLLLLSPFGFKQICLFVEVWLAVGSSAGEAAAFNCSLLWRGGAGEVVCVCMWGGVGLGRQRGEGRAVVATAQWRTTSSRRTRNTPGYTWTLRYEKACCAHLTHMHCSIDMQGQVPESEGAHVCFRSTCQANLQCPVCVCVILFFFFQCC